MQLLFWKNLFRTMTYKKLLLIIIQDRVLAEAMYLVLMNTIYLRCPKIMTSWLVRKEKAVRENEILDVVVKEKITSDGVAQIVFSQY